MTWHIVSMQKPIPYATDLAHNAVALPIERKSRTLLFYRHLFVLTTLSAAVCACAMRDHFPMKNAATGQEVTCYSGEYWYEESGEAYHISLQCMNACERYGFVWQGGNEYYKPNPKVPDDDMKQFIPAACLP